MARLVAGIRCVALAALLNKHHQVATLTAQIEEWKGELSFHYKAPASDECENGAPQEEPASFEKIPRHELFKSDAEAKADERKKRMKARCNTIDPEKEVHPKRRFGTPQMEKMFFNHKSISLKWHILTSSPLFKKQHTRP